MGSQVKNFVLYFQCLVFTYAWATPDTLFLSNTEPVPVQELESHVRSTLFFGGSAPVSFMGEARLKISHNKFSEYPGFIGGNDNWTQANWEGNESFLRLGMVVRPHRNAILWSRIGFQSTLPGNYLNENQRLTSAQNTGFEPVQTRHDKNKVSVNIHEDMSAGVALRTKPVSFWLKMGNVLWVESSPLTIWKSQPRTFAWDYLPYEIEQPISRYYEYNVAKGEKTGRAAWNKKPFNGIQLESIRLPLDLYVNAVYGTYERYDNFEKDFVDWSNDIGFSDLGTDAKSTGVGDNYRHMMHLRVSKNKIFKNMNLGVSYLGTQYRPDVVYNDLFRQALRMTRNNNLVFYKEADIYSIDAKGEITSQLSYHIDLAANIVDSTFTQFDTTGNNLPPSKYTHARPVQPALYANFVSHYLIPLQFDFGYVSEEFYSPFSFAAPVDAFYAYGSNLVGSGKFIGRGEASPYTQNMTGLQLTANPEVGYGHFKLFYGIHRQIIAARDLIYLPYRLNGQDMFSVFHTSYNRWGNGLVDNSLDSYYNKRLGDENSVTGAGGLHSDFLSFYEGFVPYPSASIADSNSSEPFEIYRESRIVPRHKKWSFNLGTDLSYDIGPLIGYSKDFFLGGFATINGISTTFTPLAMNQQDLLLWSLYLRFEPAIALTEKFYLVGLAGWENWKADNAYVDLDPTNGVQSALAPIDYKDWAWGIGFDWDVAPRVGFHGRLKWFGHIDEFEGQVDSTVYTIDNTWKSQLISGEIKMWF